MKQKKMVQWVSLRQTYPLRNSQTDLFWRLHVFVKKFWPICVCCENQHPVSMWDGLTLEVSLPTTAIIQCCRQLCKITFKIYTMNIFIWNVFKKFITVKQCRLRSITSSHVNFFSFINLGFVFLFCITLVYQTFTDL